MSGHRRRTWRRRRHHGHPFRNTVLGLVVVALFAAAGAGAVAANWVLNVWHDTPDITRLRPKPQGSISTVYAGDGTRLGFISSDTLRRKVRASDISGRMKRATVDIEDRRFYRHGGVD